MAVCKNRWHCFVGTSCFPPPFQRKRRWRNWEKKRNKDQGFCGESPKSLFICKIFVFFCKLPPILWYHNHTKKAMRARKLLQENSKACGVSAAGIVSEKPAAEEWEAICRDVLDSFRRRKTLACLISKGVENGNGAIQKAHG